MSNPISKVDDHSVIKTFIREEAPKYHPALRSTRSEETLVEKLATITSVKRDSLQELERALAKRQVDATASFDFDVQDCPWATVFEELAKAQQTQNVRDRKTNIVKKVWRGMGRTSKILTPAFDIFPGFMDANPLKGGLGLIFTIARTRVEDADKILATFEDVPSILLATEEIRQAHPGHGSLERKLEVAIEQLYVELIKGLTQCIEILVPKTKMGGVGYLANIHKGHEIDKVKGDIARCFDRVNVLNNRLLDARIEQAYTLQKEMQAQVTEIRDAYTAQKETSAEDTSRISQLVRTMSDEVKTRASSSSVAHLTTEVQEMKTILRSIARDSLVELFQEQLRQFKDNPPAPELTYQSRWPQTQAPERTMDDLLQDLVNALEPMALDSIRDLERVFHKRGSLQAPVDEEARLLWRASQFRDWMYTPYPDILFVTTGSAQLGRLSALSIICATLGLQLFDEECHSNICIQFFCGEHTRSDDRLAGPDGMLRCLLAQLAFHLHTRKMLYLPRDIVYQLDRQGTGVRLEALWDLFRRLLSQLPSDSTLFCIIDGISQYQSLAMLNFVSRLRDCIFDARRYARIKVLLTGPTRYDELVYGLPLEARQCVKLNRGSARGDGLAPPLISRRSSSQRSLRRREVQY